MDTAETRAWRLYRRSESRVTRFLAAVWLSEARFLRYGHLPAQVMMEKQA